MKLEPVPWASCKDRLHLERGLRGHDSAQGKLIYSTHHYLGRDAK